MIDKKLMSDLIQHWVNSSPTGTEAEKQEQELSMCKKRELLECTDIGATTYARLRVELHRTSLELLNKRFFDPFTYSYISIVLGGFLFTRRFENDRWISFRVTEDNGYVMNSKMMTTEEAQKTSIHLFGEYLTTRSLQGKFHLEMLFVDPDRIGDSGLCVKYATNINARLENFSDTSCLKEKVKKAEKWLDMAKKNSLQQINGNKVICTIAQNSIAQPRFAVLLQKFSGIVVRLPQEGKSNHIIVGKWFTRLPEGLFDKGFDRATIYAAFALELFNTSCAEHSNRTTHTQFEFFTENAQRIITKLRPHYQNGAEMIAENLRRYESEAFPSFFNLTIYAVDIPSFATIDRAQSRLEFVRKCLEKTSKSVDNATLHNQKIKQNEAIIHDERLTGIIFEECSELFQKNCDCKNVHLSSYCTLRMLLHKKFAKNSRSMAIHKWSIVLSDFCMEMCIFNEEPNLYARVANKLCRSSYSGEFSTGTNILCEMTVGEDVYRTKLMHHSDVGMKSVKKEMFQSERGKDVEYPKEITVAVYVVDILAFDTNEKAHQFLYNMRKENRRRDIILDEVPVENKANPSMETVDDLEIGYIDYETSSPVVHNKKVEGMCITLEENGKTTKLLNSSYFKKESDSAVKASTEPVQLQDCYNIISSKTPINTSKGRIMVFLVELDSQFLSDVLDNYLFMADIFIDIVKNTEISLLSCRRMKITLKLNQGGFPIYVILSSEDLVNPENLREKLVRRGLQSVMHLGKQFYLEVQYRVM